MKRLLITITDSTAKELREIINSYGNRKGLISILVEQAIKEWIRNQKKKMENSSL